MGKTRWCNNRYSSCLNSLLLFAYNHNPLQSFFMSQQNKKAITIFM